MDVFRREQNRHLELQIVTLCVKFYVRVRGGLISVEAVWDEISETDRAMNQD